MPRDGHTQSLTEHPPDVLEELADLLAGGHPAASWQASALCAQVDTDLFFPEKGGSTREAKKICGSCPVRQECLDDALAREERFGIWGGLSERERRRLRGRRPDAPKPPRPPRERRPVSINHGTDAGLKAHRRLGEFPCESCETGTDPTPAPPLPAPVRRERPGVTRAWTGDELAEAVRMLTDYGMTPGDIADELHVPVSRVRRVLPARRGAA